jgi:hypothetical protein
LCHLAILVQTLSADLMLSVQIDQFPAVSPLALSLPEKTGGLDHLERSPASPNDYRSALPENIWHRRAANKATDRTT